MRLLALDLATRLGFASGDTTTCQPVSGWHQLPKTGDDLGRFARAYHGFLVEVVAETSPEIIVIEEPMPTQAGKSTMATTMKLQGLCWHTEFYGEMKRLKVFQVPAQKWKKALCGTAKVSKKMKPYPPMVACAARGWDVTDDNEADALGIWLYSTQLLDPEHSIQMDPLFMGQASTPETQHHA